MSKPRLDKDLNLYTSNLEKMAQAVELIEETLAAERRKRERQSASALADATSSQEDVKEAQSELSETSAAEDSTK